MPAKAPPKRSGRRTSERLSGVSQSRLSELRTAYQEMITAEICEHRGALQRAIRMAKDIQDLHADTGASAAAIGRVLQVKYERDAQWLIKLPIGTIVKVLERGEGDPLYKYPTWRSFVMPTPKGGARAAPVVRPKHHVDFEALYRASQAREIELTKQNDELHAKLGDRKKPGEYTEDYPTPIYFVLWSAALFLPTPKYELDPFSTHENKKADRNFTRVENGFIQKWICESAFVNPVYEMKEKPLTKVWEEVECGNTKIAVVLLRLQTLGAAWFQKYRERAKYVVILHSRRFTFEGYAETAKFHSIFLMFEHGFVNPPGRNNIRFIKCPKIGDPMPSPSILEI